MQADSSLLMFVGDFNPLNQKEMIRTCTYYRSKIVRKAHWDTLTLQVIQTTVEAWDRFLHITEADGNSDHSNSTKWSSGQGFKNTRQETLRNQ